MSKNTVIITLFCIIYQNYCQIIEIWLEWIIFNLSLAEKNTSSLLWLFHYQLFHTVFNSSRYFQFVDSCDYILDTRLYIKYVSFTWHYADYIVEVCSNIFCTYLNANNPVNKLEQKILWLLIRYILEGGFVYVCHLILLPYWMIYFHGMSTVLILFRKHSQNIFGSVCSLRGRTWRKCEFMLAR